MKILHNARIYTLEISQPIASAIAVEHGCVMAVGETDELFSEFDRAKKQDMGVLAIKAVAKQRAPKEERQYPNMFYNPFIEEEEMPRTGTGKILHRILRERYGTWGDE